MYTPALNQVNTGPAPEALAGPAGSFLAGLGRLREHFQVRLLNPAQPTDAEGNVVLDLSPKQPVPTLARLILSLEPRHWEIRKAVVHDQFENTVTMQFSRVTINSGLADRLFTFVAPPGTATVPLRSPPGLLRGWLQKTPSTSCARSSRRRSPTRSTRPGVRSTPGTTSRTAARRSPWTRPTS